MRGGKFRPQFTLRGLLLVAVLVSCVMSWLGAKCEEARRQHTLLQQLGGRGLLACCKHPWNKEVSAFGSADDRVSQCLRKVFDVDPFEKVCGLYSLGILSSDSQCVAFNDDDMLLLKELPSVSTLRLDGTQLSDEGLIHLKVLHGVESLGLDRTRVTDAGLIHLQDLPRLKELSLGDTNVTDTGVASLCGIGSLESLDLRGTKISDQAFAGLMNLPRLKRLNVSYTGITDAAVANLKQMHNLEELHLGGTQMSTEARIEIANSLPKVFRSGFLFTEW